MCNSAQSRYLPQSGGRRFKMCRKWDLIWIVFPLSRLNHSTPYRRPYLDQAAGRSRDGHPQGVITTFKPQRNFPVNPSTLSSQIGQFPKQLTKYKFAWAANPGEVDILQGRPTPVSSDVGSVRVRPAIERKGFKGSEWDLKIHLTNFFLSILTHFSIESDKFF
jgi:hypothetical protein